MTSLNVGNVINPSEDVYPNTGDHVDFRLRAMYGDNRGQHVDPATRPELLARIFAGEGDNRRPITSYPMTSGFGPRQAPAPGASTFHKGHDYAVPRGTPLSIQGATEYYSQNGVGVAKLTDAQGRPYEVEIYHTNPGKFTQASSMPVASKPQGLLAQEYDIVRTDPETGQDRYYRYEEVPGSPRGRWIETGPPSVLTSSRPETEGEKDRREEFELKMELAKAQMQRKPEHLGGQSKQGAEAKALQDMQRGLFQVLSEIQNQDSEEARTRLALDKAAKEAAEAFQGGESVI